jgi:hypothetical protein
MIWSTNAAPPAEYCSNSMASIVEEIVVILDTFAGVYNISSTHV